MWPLHHRSYDYLEMIGFWCHLTFDLGSYKLIDLCSHGTQLSLYMPPWTCVLLRSNRSCGSCCDIFNQQKATSSSFIWDESVNTQTSANPTTKVQFISHVWISTHVYQWNKLYKMWLVIVHWFLDNYVSSYIPLHDYVYNHVGLNGLWPIWSFSLHDSKHNYVM